MLNLMGGAIAWGNDAAETRRETERDRAFLREQQRMHAMMAMQTGAFDAQFGYQLGDIYGGATVEYTTSGNVSFYEPPRPVPTPCGGCGATKREAHVTGWRCAYCGRDR